MGIAEDLLNLANTLARPAPTDPEQAYEKLSAISYQPKPETLIADS